jgi:hypothetical protein
LGFVAKTPVEEGIRKTMDWQKQEVLGKSWKYSS